MFNFKINELKNNIKVGFPIHSLDKYINALNDYSINNKLNSICEFIKSIYDNDIKKDIIKSIYYILDEYRW